MKFHAGQIVTPVKDHGKIGHLTYGKTYEVLDVYIGNDQKPIVRVMNDQGNREGFYEWRFVVFLENDLSAAVAEYDEIMQLQDMMDDHPA